MQNLTCAKCQKPFAPGESMYRHPVDRDSRTMERARRLSLRRSRVRRARSTKGTKTRSTRGTKNEPNTADALHKGRVVILLGFVFFNRHFPILGAGLVPPH